MRIWIPKYVKFHIVEEWCRRITLRMVYACCHCMIFVWSDIFNNKICLFARHSEQQTNQLITDFMVSKTCKKKQKTFVVTTCALIIASHYFCVFHIGTWRLSLAVQLLLKCVDTAGNAVFWVGRLKNLKGEITKSRGDRFASSCLTLATPLLELHIQNRCDILVVRS